MSKAAKNKNDGDVEQDIDKVFSDRSKEELDIQQIEEGQGSRPTDKGAPADQLESDYNKIVASLDDNNKELRLSDAAGTVPGTSNIKSRTQGRAQGANTMEPPNDGGAADYDVASPDEKKKMHGVSKSELSDIATHNDITNRQSNQDEVDKFNQT